MIEILLSSSVLILVLAILRLVLRDKISARLQYALWLLVLVRLLVPVSFFRSPLTVAEAAAPVTDRMSSRLTLTEVEVGDFTQQTALRLIDLGIRPETAELVSNTPTEGPVFRWTVTLRYVVRLVWYAGMVVMAVWFLFVNLRLLQRLKRNRRPYAPGEKPPVYVADGIPSPCLFGLFDPVIYLTEQGAADPVQARQIVAHERTHLRHGDLIWSLLRSLCLVVWWFDPFVWLAAALSRQDGELACDEGTIQALGEDVRFDYGRTLVGMAKVGAKPSDLLCGATTMTSGKRSLKARIARIAKAPKNSAFLIGLTLVIAAIAVGCTYGSSTPRVTTRAEVAYVPPAAEEVSEASDSDALGPGYAVILVDNETGDILALTSSPEMETEPEVIGTYDRAYWEEVERELGGFADPTVMGWYTSDDFDEAIPEDSMFGPMTIEDYIYGTDSWRFEYDSEYTAVDHQPFAEIRLDDANGRTLVIDDAADALMIVEADGSFTRVTYAGDPVDCADMIRHLLPWARGEYTGETPAASADEAQKERTDQILAELGLYTLTGREPTSVDGSTDYYDEQNSRPLWGKLVSMSIQADTHIVDLGYFRWWSDEDMTEPANDEFFASIQSSTAEIYPQTTGLSVNGCEAFTYTDTIGFTSIVWLDEEAGLIFQLIDPIPHGETAATDDELIAMAESVSPQ